MQERAIGGAIDLLVPLTFRDRIRATADVPEARDGCTDGRDCAEEPGGKCGAEDGWEPRKMAPLA